MSQENLARVREAYEAAFGRGDMGPMIALMHQDIEWVEPDGAPGVGRLTEGSGVYRGRDDVVNRLLAQIPSHYDNFRIDAEQYLDAGDHIVVLGHLRGNVPGTGAMAEAPVAHFWRFDADQVVWWRCYEDTAMLHRARGAL